MTNKEEAKKNVITFRKPKAMTTLDKLLKELKSEYEPGGDEYKAHIMKLPKWFIVKLLTAVQQERDDLKELMTKQIDDNNLSL